MLIRISYLLFIFTTIMKKLIIKAINKATKAGLTDVVNYLEAARVELWKQYNKNLTH